MGLPNKRRLTLSIFAAIVLAITCALLAPEFAVQMQIGGEIFLRLLKMMVVPLILSSVTAGMLSLGDVRKLGRPGLVMITYYLGTTLLAASLGLILVNVIRPGIGTIGEEAVAKAQRDIDLRKARTAIRDALAASAETEEGLVATIFEELPAPPAQANTSVIGILKGLALMLFTDNLFQAASRTELLPLIVFSILFSSVLTTMGTQVETVRKIVNELNDALLNFILLIMRAGPLGIFCLIASRFGHAHLEGHFAEEITQISKYVLAVILGLGLHAGLILPCLLFFTTGRGPARFAYQMSQSLLTAFSTASSAATLPITMECAVENAGISKRSSEFVLPLGASINMDGTALYEAVAAVFIAQAVGVDLTFYQQVTVLLTATLAAVGAAGIPEAGLVTMLIVLNAVGLPLSGIGLILSVDWLLDRMRTAVNTFGDAVGAAIVDQVGGRLDATDTNPASVSA